MANLEFYKYVEINQHIPISLIEEQIKRKIIKYFEINERTYGLQLKLCLEGNLKLEKPIFIIYCEFVYYF